MKIGIFYQMLIMDQGFFALKKFVKLQIHVNTKVYKGFYEPLPVNVQIVFTFKTEQTPSFNIDKNTMQIRTWCFEMTKCMTCFWVFFDI